MIRKGGYHFSDEIMLKLVSWGMICRRMGFHFGG